MLRILKNCTLCEALYNFSTENPDDLQFNVGELIAIYKKVDGGWCEGWTSGRIGWFPENYTKPMKTETTQLITSKQSIAISQNFFSILDSFYEKEHIFIQNFSSLYDTNLQIINTLNDEELSKNFQSIYLLLDLHNKFIAVLQSNKNQQSNNLSFGYNLLELFNLFKQAYSSHCYKHSEIIFLIERNNSIDNGIMIDLCQFISKPFFHMESYPIFCLELLRQFNSEHPDYSNLKKCCILYDILWQGCNEIRRHETLKLEIFRRPMETNQITMNPLECTYAVQIFIAKEDFQRVERYFCLFPKCMHILILTNNGKMSIENSFPYSSFTIKNLNDTENLFNAIQFKIQDEYHSLFWNCFFTSPYEKDSFLMEAKSFITIYLDSQMKDETNDKPKNEKKLNNKIDSLTNSVETSNQLYLLKQKATQILRSSQHNVSITSPATKVINMNGSRNFFLYFRPSYFPVIPVIIKKANPVESSSFNFMKNTSKKVLEEKCFTYLLEIYDSECKTNTTTQIETSSTNLKASKNILSTLMKPKKLSPRLVGDSCSSSSVIVAKNEKIKIQDTSADNNQNERDKNHKPEALLNYIANQYGLDLGSIEKSDEFLKFCKSKN